MSNHSDRPSHAAPRVAVTGVGAVCAFGWSADDLYRGLRRGSPAISEFRRFDGSKHRTQIAAEVPEPPPDVASWLNEIETNLSVADRFALAATREALNQAKLLAAVPHDCAVFYSSSTGGMWEGELFWNALVESHGTNASTSLIRSQQHNGPGDAVARTFGCGGPLVSVSSACASSAMAIASALDALRLGEVDLAIVGGSDSLCETTYAGFNALRSIDPQPSRPLRADRQGLSLGEGAGTLILEREDSARARGVTPLAFVAGAGMSCDASHMTAPQADGSGPAQAIAAALVDADLDGAAIDFVNLHGTGTPRNDVAEWNAVESILGARARQVPVTSTKSLIGHLLGAAGAIEATATIDGLRHAYVHAAGGDGALDDDIHASLVLGSERALERHRAALSTNLGFGGANAAVIFSCGDVTTGSAQ